MACDTWKSRPDQTLTERKEEIRKVIDLVAQAIVNGRVKPKVGPQGAVTFEGLDAVVDRRGVTDACVVRRIMSTGSALAKQQLARAEQLAGRASMPRRWREGTTLMMEAQVGRHTSTAADQGPVATRRMDRVELGQGSLGALPRPIAPFRRRQKV